MKFNLNNLILRKNNISGYILSDEYIIKMIKQIENNKIEAIKQIYKDGYESGYKNRK